LSSIECRGAPPGAPKLGDHTCVPKHFGAQAQRATPTKFLVKKIPQNTKGCKRKDREKIEGPHLQPWRDIDTIEDLINLSWGTTKPLPD